MIEPGGTEAPRIPIDAPPRQVADAIDRAQATLDARLEARALPMIADDGTVDIGLGRPVDGGIEVVDVDTGVVRTVAVAVEEMNDDAALVRQMRACLL